MYRVVERRPVNVYMSGEVVYGQQLVGYADTMTEAEKLRIQRHQRRGTDKPYPYRGGK